MRPGDTIANRFEIVARAGSGGWGTVYRGRDRPGWRDVAIKVLHPDAGGDAQRFDQEARLLAEFDHPHIVRYVAHGHTMTGERYLVMEWIEGQTLAKRLVHEGLTLRQTVTLMRRIAEAIGYAHGRGVVHRDVKPNNILFAQRDVARAKVIDFGIALRTQDAIRLTASGTVLGTPSYMSPEQARAAKEIDARSDVFSLGCVLFECLTGAVAFSGSNPLAVRAKALAVDPPPVRSLRPEIPEALEALVSRMLAKDPAARPPDARAVAAELARLPEAGEGQAVRRGSRAGAGAESEEEDHLELATTEDTRPPVAVILAAIPKDYANLAGHKSAALESRREVIAKVAAAQGVELEILAGRAALVVLRGEPGDPFVQAAPAAECALAVREACPELSLVVTLGDDHSLHRVIERGARTMEAAVQRAILEGGKEMAFARAGVIRLDAYAAAVLESEFRVSQPEPGSYFLDGRKATG